MIFGLSCFTLVYLICAWLLFFDSPMDFAGIATEWRALDLNAAGDTFAGLFAPLALIWAIGAVLIQSKELKGSRRVFQRQHDEAIKKTIVDSMTMARPELTRKAKLLGELIVKKNCLRISEVKNQKLYEIVEAGDWFEGSRYGLRNLDWEKLTDPKNKKYSYLRELSDYVNEYVSVLTQTKSMLVSNSENAETFLSWYLDIADIGRLNDGCESFLSKARIILDNVGIDGGYQWKFSGQDERWIKKPK